MARIFSLLHRHVTNPFAEYVSVCVCVWDVSMEQGAHIFTLHWVDGTPNRRAVRFATGKPAYVTSASPAGLSQNQPPPAHRV